MNNNDNHTHYVPSDKNCAQKLNRIFMILANLNENEHK